MKTLDEVIKAWSICFSDNSRSDCTGCPYADDDGDAACFNHDREDALHYLKEYRVVTDICHKHGIASVWGQVLPDPEKTDWDKKLNFDNAYDNDPLDWETLKQMEGKPVWFEWTGSPRWGIVDGVYTNAYGVENLVICIPHDYLHFDKRMQGQVWQAYRKERS